MPERCVLSFSELPTSGAASRQTHRQTHRPTQHPGHDVLALTKDASTTQGPTHAHMIKADVQHGLEFLEIGGSQNLDVRVRVLVCRIECSTVGAHPSPEPRTLG